MGLFAGAASLAAAPFASRAAQPAAPPAGGFLTTRADLPPPPKAPENVPGTRAPRGRNGRMERLPEIDLESRMDFLMSLRTFANQTMSPAAGRRAQAILESKGMAPDAQMPMKEAIALLENDPMVQARTRTWMSVQQLSWDNLKKECENNADAYLSEMEAVDHCGPGTLELNPGLKMPDYACHEIHIQPGGYVGNDFAGHMYDYGTNGFYTGKNEQDALHMTAAFGLPIPADGKIRRILDLGTGVGQLAMALKERFPEAEVWGLDAGGPMVRYAHLRAVERGLDINFAQRLAEDTRFPDNHFDLVTSYIMLHEVSPQGTKDIVNEAYRITRPGGLFYPIDFDLKNPFPSTAYGQYRRWWDHRWNNEVWTIKYRTNGLQDLVRAAGFDLNEEGPVALPRFGVMNATKPA